jgi:AGZA family xanthine/uracil permease-like MFS transporter
MASIASYFELKKRGTTVGTEVRAGITTFLVMGYIVFVNPLYVSSANGALTGSGAPGAVAVAACTALAAGILTIAMGMIANYPFALAAGMGLNAVVAFDLIAGKGLSWEEAMAVIVWEGVIITILVLTGFRKAILEAIPLSLKRAIAVGIGLFLLMIGLFEGGIIVKSPAPTVPLTLGFGTTPMATLAVFGTGLVIALVLIGRKKGPLPGALLIAISAATLVALAVGVTSIPATLVSPLDANNFAGIGAALGSLTSVWSNGVGVVSVALAVFTIMLSDFFDTAGTIVGLGERGGMLDKKGQLPGSDKVLLVDSIAAGVGGLFGVSSNTTYIESAAGIEEGGRTGLTSVVTGLLFLAALIVAPIAGIIPAAATAPALVVVGYLMFQSIRDVKWSDTSEGFPILATLIIMPLAYSITDGIGAGFITYGLLKAAKGEAGEVKPLLWVAVAAYVVYFALKLGLIG